MYIIIKTSIKINEKSYQRVINHKCLHINVLIRIMKFNRVLKVSVVSKMSKSSIPDIRPTYHRRTWPPGK